MKSEQPRCVFCRIIAGEIPSDLVYRDDQVVAFRDIHPAAPTHILIVPRAHIASLADATREQQALLGHMMLVAKELAEKAGVAARGFRVVVNSGAEGGQVVPHLHMHLLAGRRMDDEMG